mmetsp:Transcript_35788/g.86388  ORF Transcript_35788/g.86388 Transcript_35788/m.86388 type:complete len:213 (-) Transcript_35788:301-939(-)
MIRFRGEESYGRRHPTRGLVRQYCGCQSQVLVALHRRPTCPTNGPRPSRSTVALLFVHIQWTPRGHDVSGIYQRGRIVDEWQIFVDIVRTEQTLRFHDVPCIHLVIIVGRAGHYRCVDQLPILPAFVEDGKGVCHAVSIQETPPFGDIIATIVTGIRACRVRRGGNMSWRKVYHHVGADHPSLGRQAEAQPVVVHPIIIIIMGVNDDVGILI